MLVNSLGFKQNHFEELFEFFLNENILEDYFCNEKIGKPSFKVHFSSDF